MHLPWSALFLTGLSFLFSSATAQNCAAFEQALDHCLQFGVGGASTNCKACVDSRIPTLVNPCSTIRTGFCNAFETCSCGSCEVQTRQYYNCLLGDICSLTECIIGPTPAPVPDIASGETPQCEGSAVSTCEEAFRSVRCSSCDPQFCVDIRDNYCSAACQHPGCGCTIDFGQCNLFNPNFPSSSNTVRCAGSPFECNEIFAEALCNNAVGCRWVEAVPAPPAPTPEPEAEAAGTCVGSSIPTCNSLFDTSVCSACENADCLGPANMCQASCDHPGCSCMVETGICNLYSQFGTNPNVISCSGVPQSCRTITSQSVCDRATNCVWLEAPAPDPTPQTGEEGFCFGQATSACSSLYPGVLYDSCQNIPFNAYQNCISDCLHPGCGCQVTRGVCGAGFSSLTCEGAPRSCSLIFNLEDCLNASGCFWQDSQQAEPTPAPVPPTAPTCSTDASLSCATSTGGPCSTASAPSNTKCATGNRLFSLQFEYTGQGCNGHANRQVDTYSCRDVGPLSSVSQVAITCVNTDTQGVLDVNPPRVVPGQYFIISNAAALPNSITCAVSNPNVSGAASILQAVTFDASGTFELDLKDGFGSMQLVRCDAKTCLDQFLYRTVVTNTDSRNLRITSLSLGLTSTGSSIDLLGSTSSQVLAPSGTATADFRRAVDLCEVADLGATARVAATATLGSSTCSDSATIAVPILPLCGLQVTQTCKGFGETAGPLEGRRCQNLPGEPSRACSCPSGCARQLRFRYTGQFCGANTSSIMCRDVTGTLPQDAARIVIQRTDSLLTLYDNPRVARGEEFMFSSNNSCLPGRLTVQIMIVGTSQVMQTFDLVTGCGNGNPGISLLGPYGALQFTGYTCNANDVHNCFVNIEHSACVENDGTDTRTIASFELEFGSSIFNLLQGVGQADRILPAGGTFCNQVVTEIPLCTNGAYRTVASARSDPRCADADLVFSQLNFNIVAGATPVPTLQILPETPSPPVPTPPTPPTPDDCPTAIRPVFAPPLPPGCL